MELKYSRNFSQQNILILILPLINITRYWSYLFKYHFKIVLSFVNVFSKQTLSFSILL